MRFIHKNKILHTFRSGLLACVYLSYWVLFVAHPWTEAGHDHDHGQKICRAADGETHLHGEEYIHKDCSICQIAPAIADLPPIHPEHTAPSLLPRAAANWPSVTAPLPFRYTIAQPRAPPAV